MKKRAIAAILLFIGLWASAEQYTRIGVVDMGEIVNLYYTESRAYRELLELRDTFQEEIEAINQDISQLRQRMLEAEIGGDEREKLRLENQISQKEQYKSDYVRIKQDQLNRLRDDAMRDGNFMARILGVIEQVAQSEGFSIVLRKDDSSVLYFSETVDITDLVLDSLRG